MKTTTLVLLIFFLKSSFADQIEKLNNNEGEGYKKEALFVAKNAVQLWEKAKKLNIDENTLERLRLELKFYDQRKIELKHLKTQGGDKDGFQEATLQKHFNSLTSKYGLTSPNEIPDEEFNFEGFQVFSDLKLKKLWQKIVKSHDFSKEEMKKLLTEFQHHEDKLKEMHNLLGDKAEQNRKIAGSLRDSNDLESNDADGYHLELRDEIVEGFHRLQLISNQMKDENHLFTEPRVHNLWMEALEKNFTEAELESLKVQLGHFQTRIDKHRFFKKQLQNSANPTTASHDEGGRQKFSDEHIQKKVRSLGDQVNKMHSHLKKRVRIGVMAHHEL